MGGSGERRSYRGIFRLHGRRPGNVPESVTLVPCFPTSQPMAGTQRGDTQRTDAACRKSGFRHFFEEANSVNQRSPEFVRN